MSCFDCRLCVYYTWEPSLLCAVDPITAERGDAANCRDFRLDNFIVDGVVVKEIVVYDSYDTTVQYGFGPDNLFGGYGIAVSIDGWKYLTCEVQYFKMVYTPLPVYSLDYPEEGYARAVDLPYEWVDHYEGGLISALVVTRDAHGFIRAVDIPDNNVYEEDFVDNEFKD